MFAAVLSLSIITIDAQAAPPYVIPPPSQGAFGVGATVNAPAPKEPPVIKTPTNGQTITTLPNTVQGTCPKGTLVKVYKNGALAGAAICDASASFSVPIDLFIGSNTLTAQAFNTVEKSSPPSAAVVVTYAPSGAPTFGIQPQGTYSPGLTAASQLFLKTDVYHRGAYPGEQVTFTIAITGGVPPYAVSVAWGDGKTDLISRGKDGPFELSHTYDKTGAGYRGSTPVVFKASDASGATAYMQVVAIINNSGVLGASQAVGGNLGIAWPLLAIIIAILVSFFLGERREKKILHKRGLI